MNREIKEIATAWKQKKMVTKNLSDKTDSE